MTSKKIRVGSLLVVALFSVGALVAQRPVENIDPHRHANLGEAQHHVVMAFDKAEEAQKANREELGGHADKAKQHLVEADQELKMAAEFADHRK